MTNAVRTHPGFKRAGIRLSLIRRIGVVIVMFLLVFAGTFAQAETIRFDIDRFNVEGNTLLKQDRIDAALAPFTGKQRDYSDIQRAVAVLGRLYRAAGFSVVRVVIPEQELGRGVVTLRVMEGRISKVTLAGNRSFDEVNIRRSLPALKEGTSPKAAEISANVQLANENPAKQVDVVLRQDKLDVIVDVIDVRPFKVFMTLDSTGNPQTGDFRLGAGIQHANLFNRDHVGTFNYVTSPGKENKVSLYSASYRLPIYAWGDSMDFIGAYSDVSSGTTQTVAGPLTFSGKGTVYGMRYNQLLPRRGEYSHRIVYGLDYRAYENDCALGVFGAAGCGPAAVDVTATPVSVAYSGNWSRQGNISDFYGSVSQNVPVADHGSERDFKAARPSTNGSDGASSRYSVFRFGASMVNAFESNWQIRAAFNAQYSTYALISGEQFGLAGATAVRGFMEREIARDTGYVATLELYTPNLTGKLVPGEGNLRGLLFADMGRGGNNLLPGEDRQDTAIASIGAGIRWNLQRNFNLRFDLARIMDEAGKRSIGDIRGHISVYVGL